MSGHVRGHLFLRVLFDTHLHHYPLAYEIVIFVRGRLVDSATVRTAGVRSGAAVVAPGTAVVALAEAKFILSLNTQPAEILQIFGGLVLGCIKTKFCKKICV